MSANESLILFTIGPVQRFIETARKTEDLWMGSYILSYLNGFAMNTLIQQKQLSEDETQQIFLFPAVEEQPLLQFFQRKPYNRERLKLPTLPNRFLAKMDSDRITKADLETLETKVRTEFLKIAEYVFNQTFENFWKGTYAEELLKRQGKNFLEIYWVIHPISATETYQKAYAAIESELGGVKNCRWFGQTQEESLKCSLCGEREVIHFQNFADEPMGTMKHEIAQEWENHWHDSKDTRRHKYMRSNEYLCAVCLTKRMGELYFQKELNLDLKGAFPSTAEVATAAFKFALYHGEYKDVVQQQYHKFVEALLSSDDLPAIKPLPKITMFKDRTIDRDVDGSWLYEEAFEQKALTKEYPQHARLLQQAQALDKKRQTLLKQEKERSGTTPAKYYAVIVLDGDDIGKKLTAVHDETEHQQISQALGEYASEVQQIVEQQHLGKLLYAGGDDVVALANLQDLFQILQVLRRAFPDFRTKITRLTELSIASFGASAGVCIAHYKTPLGEVIKWARMVEKEAKSIDKKDAVGIALLKHSGNIGKTVVKWQHETFETISLAEDVITALQEWISNKFLYSLREEFGRILERENPIEGERRHPIEAELFRLLNRRKRKEEISKEQIRQLAQRLAGLLVNIESFEAFTNFLEICNFIAREG